MPEEITNGVIEAVEEAPQRLDGGPQHKEGPALPDEPEAQRSLAARWLYILRTGNPPEDGHLDVVSKWLVLTRAAVQPMTLTSALLAGAAAWRSPDFHWGLYLIAVLGLVAAHACNNLMNDLFDLAVGSDTDDYPRALYAPHPVLSGMASRKTLLVAALLLNLVDVAIMLALFTKRGWPIIGFAIAGFILSVGYTAPPLRLKRIALGELAVFLVWGPLMIGGTYYAAVGKLSWKVIAFSVPYGLVVTSVLLGKHIDKIPWDRELGIRTLPVVIGEGLARSITRMSMWAFYVLVGAGILARIFPWPTAVVYLGLPTLLRVDRVLSRPRPEQAPERFPVWPLWFAAWTFLHTRRAGALLVAGCLVGSIFWPTALT
jgi:1,4-dihydroxy-2-naphthoate octaprenyltransferase